MGKKKSAGGAKTPHQTQSFAQLVGQANRDALKPYIHQVFGEMANDLSRRVFRQMANIQTRMMALEEIMCQKLGVSEEEIIDMVAMVEDDATGYQLAQRPAQEGDLVRLSIRTRAKDKADWSDSVRRQVTKLMNIPLSLGSAQVEGAIIGMSSGDTKTVVLEDDFQVELLIDRVSEKKPTPAETAPAQQPQAQTESAPQLTDEGVVEQTAGIAPDTQSQAQANG